MAREVQRENRRDVLGEYIAQAYAQGLCKVPIHLKPPYNKTKFAYYRARLKTTPLQPRNPDPLAPIPIRAPGDLPDSGASPSGDRLAG